MKKMALFLVIAMVFSLVMGSGVLASGEASGEAADSTIVAEATGDRTLRVFLSAEPGSINPLSVTSAGDCNYVAQCMYDTLIFFNSDTNELEPSVATAWEWIDDTHLQVTIRDDVVAVDGTLFTADDVLYTIERGVTGDAKSNWQYVDFDECSVVDDTTLIIGLTEVHPTYVSLLASVMFVPLVDESSVEANGGWENCIRSPYCATGPYSFGEWVDGEYIRLLRNDDYWGEKAYFDEIIFSWVADSTSRTMAVAAGDGSFAVDINSADYISLDTYDNCVGYVVPGTGTSCLFLNTDNEYLSNELVREAIYYALDAEAMRMVGAAGLGSLADSVLPSSNAFYVPSGDADTRATNIEKARELLAEAGYPDGFTLDFPLPSFDQIGGEVIQACLSQIGITVNLDTMEFFSYLSVSDTGAYDMAIQKTTPTDVTTALGYFDNRIPQNLRFGGIVGGFDDLNEIIDVCRYSTDEEVLMQGWADFQNYIREHYLVIPFYENSFFYAADGEYNMLYNSDGAINFARVSPAE